MLHFVITLTVMFFITFIILIFFLCSDDWLFDPRFIFGTGVFIFGMAMNIHSDYILINLRKPGETGYKIPRGGMFNYVSSANYGTY